MASSAEDDKSLHPMRPQTPQEEEGIDECDGQVRCYKAPPLPTPEEKMRMQAQAVPTDVIPINVTGRPHPLAATPPIVTVVCPRLNMPTITDAIQPMK